MTAPIFFGTAQSFIMIYIFCDHSVWKPSGVLFHKRTGALFGPDTVANQSQKAQPFLVEAVQNGTLSQCKKVTEENKTAELPGGASPTHTLTHKCRYAAYSMRFTESNPPPHTDTHLHSFPPFCVYLLFSCSLTHRFSLRRSRSEVLMCHIWLWPQGNTEGKRFSLTTLPRKVSVIAPVSELSAMTQISKTGANVTCPQVI